jgi:hypothetical protein
MAVVMVTRMEDDEIDPLMSLEKKIHVNYKNQTCMRVPCCNNFFSCCHILKFSCVMIQTDNLLTKQKKF